MTTLRLGSRLGQYILEAEVASGGYATVYRAVREGPGGFAKQVAIKVLSVTTVNPKRLESLFREARNVGLLNHRNVVQVHEVAEQDGLHFLVMELVDGLTLGQLNSRRGDPLPTWLVAGIGLEVARALVCAHSFRDADRCPRGIVHRDVKPSNILISSQGDVKLTDFGLAKMVAVARDDLTQVGLVKGTPSYMSPEQAAGDDISPAVDVYSLGVTLYRTLAGRGAARWFNEFDPLLRLPSLSRFNPTAPESLCACLSSAMHRDPHRRPSARNLARRLEQELATLASAEQISRFVGELGRAVREARGQLEQDAPGSGTMSNSDDSPVFAPQRAALEPLTDGGEPSTDGIEPAGAPSLSVPRALPARPAKRGALWGAAAILLVGAAVVAFLVAGSSVPAPSGSSADAAGVGVAARGPVLDRGRREDAAPARTVVDAGRSPDLTRRPVRRRQSARSRPPVRPPEPVGRGLFSVNAEPWAWVEIDGRRVGMTPLYRRSVPSGPHTVTLLGSNGATARRQVVIEKGKHTSLGLVELR
jgi:serine/threonine protein kinase